MFLSNFITVSRQAVMLFIMMAIGFALYRLRLVDAKGVTGITNVLLWAVTPSLLIETFSRQFDAALARSLAIFALSALAALAISGLLAILIFRRGEENDRVILRFSVVFSNCGFMGLPLAQALYGDEGVMYASIFVAVFNLSMWTWGFAMMSGKGAPIKRLLLNPGLIGLALGIPLFVFSVQLPDIIMTPISSVAGLNTPLAMIVIGCQLAQADLLATVREGRVYFVCLIKLLVLPMIFLAMLHFVPLPLDVLPQTVLIIEIATPSAAMGVMMGAMCGRNSELAGRCVALSTLFSAATLPLMVTLCDVLL